ncbi:MAG TPA: hypothetical protein VJ044_05835 [Candidatus Hodarchaeales archaeon]|nr:hypothetical protein [Candidatus Hodarchaeales archaeon]
MTNKELDILEKPKATVIKDLASYLAQIRVEMNVDRYEYLVEDRTGMVRGVKLWVRVLGVSKPVNVIFHELGFAQVTLTRAEADKIFGGK